MSTSPTPDDTAGPNLTRAGHVGDEFAMTTRLCEETLLSSPLDYLAHYSSGVFDLSVDRLDSTPDEPPRPVLERVGRQLAQRVTEFDRRLQEVRTGWLIRTVLQTPAAAAFCESVVPRQDVVGVVLDRPAPGPDRLLTDHADVENADRAMAALTTRLRQMIQLYSQNPGGWETADDTGPLASPVTERAHVSVNRLGEHDERLSALLTEVLRPRGLHLVAYCHDGAAMVVTDLFEHPALASFFTQISIDARRRFYEVFSGELSTIVSMLNRTVRGVLDGLLARVVLDVEQGAIYYYRIGPGDYLVGVTLDQFAVSYADRRMARLAREVGGLAG